MAKFPIELRVSDTKLSQIKNWKIPHFKRKIRSFEVENRSTYKTILHSSRQLMSEREISSFEDNSNDISCRLKYQQAYITAYTKFFSSDHNSGRESSLLSRRINIEVTDLISSHLRLSDPKVALLRGNIIEGLTSGKTEIQAVSPITGRLIGVREIQVSSDKETITDLEVNLVSKLSLQVKPDEYFPHVWSAKVEIISKLVAQYQEAILDVKVHYSDQSWVPLSDIINSHYQLYIDTFEKNETASASFPGLNFPRIIALNEAKDQTKDHSINVFLEISDQCQKSELSIWQ